MVHGPGTYLTATFIENAEGAPDIVPRHLDAGTRIVRYDAAARAVPAITDNSDPTGARSYMGWLGRSYGSGITTRSWITVRRIVTKIEG
jgi:hypothetical protein